MCVYIIQTYLKVLFRVINYRLSDNAVLVKVESQARALAREPPQLSSQPRSEDSDWDALVKYGMRKIER